MPLRPHRIALDRLYSRYTRRELMAPDPVAFLHGHGDVRDREIVGLVASCLAYGRAAHISKSVARVLRCMPSPSRFLRGATRRSLEHLLAGFKHRFTTEDDMVMLLLAAKHAIERYGSLEDCFVAGLGAQDETVVPALTAFVEELTGGRPSYLLPCPTRGSACKRLHLFLRWMVRQDAVDLGGWDRVPASRLIIPLDTHMHRIGLALRATESKQANLRTAIEMTAAFRTIAPRDPVRYDFALTRLGIRADTDMDGFLRECGVAEAEHCG